MNVNPSEIIQICREIGSDKKSDIQKRIDKGYSFTFVEKTIGGDVMYIGIKCVEDGMIILY